MSKNSKNPRNRRNSSNLKYLGNASNSRNSKPLHLKKLKKPNEPWKPKNVGVSRGIRNSTNPETKGVQAMQNGERTQKIENTWDILKIYGKSRIPRVQTNPGNWRNSKNPKM